MSHDPAPFSLAAFRYLNSLPLLAGLIESPPLPEASAARLTLHEPARCAEMLAAGEVDGALIPSIEYARISGLIGGLQLAPGLAVSTAREVRSVVLLARRPVRECRSIALDSSSRTSVALLRILLARRFRTNPELEAMPPDAEAMLARHDAALLIADNALAPPPEGATVHDLAAEWHDWTGLPFVFAVWALRPGTPGLPAIVALLSRSLERGLAMLPQIAEREAPRVGLSPAAALAYLRDNLRYDLGPTERRGLSRFLSLAAEEGLAPPCDLQLAGQPAVVGVPS